MRLILRVAILPALWPALVLAQAAPAPPPAPAPAPVPAPAPAPAPAPPAGAGQPQLRQPPTAVAGPTSPITRFTLLRAELRFAGGGTYATVTVGEDLSAELRLLSEGAGALSGRWELSAPGQSGFRPIGRVRIPLAGRQGRTVQAPALPTGRPGIHELRFRPDGGAAALSSIRYAVIPAAPEPQRPPVSLIAPADGAAISGATVFRWMAAAAATRHRVEFVDAGGDVVLGVDLRGTEMSLRPPSLDRLDRSGAATLRWRVTSYDDAGRVVAVSGLRGVATGRVR